MHGYTKDVIFRLGNLEPCEGFITNANQEDFRGKPLNNHPCTSLFYLVILLYITHIHRLRA